MKKYRIGLFTALFVMFMVGSFTVHARSNEGTVTIAGTLSPTETTETTSSSSSSEEVPQISSTTYETAIDSQKTDNLPQLGDQSMIALLSLISGLFLLVIVMWLLIKKRKDS